MRKTLLWIVLVLSTAAQGAAFGAGKLAPAAPEQQAAHLAAEILTRYHYKPSPLDENLSSKIFDGYLKALDSEKVFFVQADVDRLSAYRTRLGDAILKEDLTAPFAIFNLYENRAAERFAHARALVKQGFDFSKAESYEASREKAAWPANEAEMNELWRKRVKSDWLRLRLSGESDESIIRILDRRYDNFQKRIAQVKSADAFQTFMNAYTMAIEPHTNYMGPRAAEDFDISMSLSLVGIGAVLADQEGYATIRELVPGGPAALSGELKKGDRIVGVAQGRGTTATDVQGWRLDDTVALIRGAVDTVVVLDVIPAEAGLDGKHKTVTIVRKKVGLEQQAAKGTIRTVEAGKGARRIGVITLPSFYEDFAGRQKGLADYKSASRDVARLLKGFKQDGVDGVLIDLRDNGGGSLNEAINLTGLFIDTGPVVQQRDAAGAISVGRDTIAGVAWDGPLAVLINRASASASEIFAAAIQDYGRGVIIGEPSFGKGTVQTMVDLDRVAKNGKPQYGELKMTIAQFFRIDGGTTQLHGVTPDIALPSASDSKRFGESSYDNALPWSRIRPAEYSRVGDIKPIVPVLRAMHDARVRNDTGFRYLVEDIAEASARRARNVISLNEAERRKERDAERARIASREGRTKAGTEGAAGDVAGTGLGAWDDGRQVSERSLADELAIEKVQKDKKDVLLSEAVRILNDQVTVRSDGAAVAARARPRAGALAE
ncbi:MAG TPA: carboxy terminal-processing peptidase [Burkholderiales bacterium]|nr:carboxy terminal-processing peptidase [Burkholderiales bacterium]